MNVRRAEPPETMDQARRHGWHVRRYESLGLCPRCASQAAWGHQVGWTRVHRPCDPCRPLVDKFDLPQVNGWHSIAATSENRDY